MAMFSRLLLALLLAGMLLPFAPRSASACSCQALTGDEQLVRLLLDSADAVVVANVEVIDSATPREIVARAETRLVYAGDAPRSFEVRAGSDTEGCGYPDLANGGDHLMFLSRRDDYYQTSYCSAFPVRFDPVSRGVQGRPEEFLATLTAVSPPEASNSTSTTRGGNEPSGRTQLIVGSIFVAAALVVGLVALRRLQSPDEY